MCGRYNLTATAEQMVDTFGLRRLPRYETSYNIPPGQKILTIVKLGDGSNKGVRLHWGLMPHWSKDSKIRNHLINARAETLSEKPSFKTAYQQRRCLIPATGFYEWQQTEQGKQVYSIYQQDQPLFAFAGLWEYWNYGTETLYSSTIITTLANALMSPIHHRMPVIVDKNNYSTWLDKQTSQQTTQEIVSIDGYQGMVAKPVSDWVNNPQHNDTNCLNECE